MHRSQGVSYRWKSTSTVAIAVFIFVCFGLASGLSSFFPVFSKCDSSSFFPVFSKCDSWKSSVERMKPDQTPLNKENKTMIVLAQHASLFQKTGRSTGCDWRCYHSPFFRLSLPCVFRIAPQILTLTSFLAVDNRKKSIVFAPHASLAHRTAGRSASWDRWGYNFLHFLSPVFLRAVSNRTTNSELKRFKTFPAVEKQLTILWNISGLLLYR